MWLKSVIYLNHQRGSLIPIVISFFHEFFLKSRKETLLFLHISWYHSPSHQWPSRIQLFRERLSEKMCTRQSRKVLLDMINTLFLIFYCCFPLAFANIRPWPLVPFFQISLKNKELKTTHNTFRDCRVHFFRQPFSK